MDVRAPLTVAAGGAIGTAARLAVDLAIPDVPDFPLAIVIVNVVGAFLVGLIAARMPAYSTLRTFLATGVLGGFTTYSAFAVATVLAWASAPALALAFVLASFAFGLAAAWAGLRLGRPRQAGSA